RFLVIIPQHLQSIGADLYCTPGQIGHFLYYFKATHRLLPSPLLFPSQFSIDSYVYSTHFHPRPPRPHIHIHLHLHLHLQNHNPLPVHHRPNNLLLHPHIRQAHRHALRPAPPQPPPPTNDTGKPARHFNTSRTLKAVNDSSTIDFAYLPESGSDAQASNQAFRVPILPGREASDAVKARNTEAETPVFIPVVSTASADDTHIHAPSALSETTSDLQGLASSVAKTLQTRSEGEGMTKQILNDLWEDIVELGQGGKPLAKA
ncbi:hypothetical protein JI435_050010, partial [Parastagonospora nodorum SN15]